MPEGEGLETQVSGNGHDPEADAEEFAGGRLTLDRRNRNVITMDNRQYASVLQQLIHSEADINQEIVRAFWESREDMINWCNAYDECIRHGADTTWLERRLKAARAGIAGWLVKSVEDTISHTTYTVNGQDRQKRAWSFLRGNNGNDNGKLPPL